MLLTIRPSVSLKSWYSMSEEDKLKICIAINTRMAVEADIGHSILQVIVSTSVWKSGDRSLNKVLHYRYSGS
jgi:hypothetical protein